jgi:CRISPR-associated protein Csc1
MTRISGIHMWQCDLTLQDYLFFATARRGHISETGRFIHNYALTYALGWAKSELHVERQTPQYEQQLNNIKGFYITPAHLLTGSHTLMSQRMEMEGYALSTMPNSKKMNCSSAGCFRPGSAFRFYILTRLILDSIPPLVRLGKFMAKAKITAHYAEELEVGVGDYTASSLLNWSDMAIKPRLCDVIVYALPGRLIQNARFTGAQYLKAEFTGGRVAKLPMQMGYYKQELCSDWLGNTA